jgi:hypothetical protein
MHSLLLRQGRKPKHGVPFLRCRNGAYDVAFLIIGGSQRFRERAPTSVAEEVVVGHTELQLLELSAKF